MSRSRLGNTAITGAVSTAPIAAVHATHTARGEALREVPPVRLSRSPWQPRTEIDRGDDFAALVESVRAHGILEPLLARELPTGALELLAGERRLEAAKSAGLAAVPVRVLEGLSDAGARAIAITENLARRDLSAWEEAAAVRQLRDARREEGLPVDVRALAAASGRSKSVTAELVRIAEHLTPEVVEAARLLCGGAFVRTPDTVAHQTLNNAATGATPEDRARRLAMACGLLTERATNRDAEPAAAAPDKAQRFTTTGDPKTRFAFRLLAPVEKLSPADAAAALDSLTPLLRALRSRARA